MLVSIGKRRQSAELVELLLECHGRIRQFTALARDIGERPELSAADVTDVCGRVRRYFVEALPLHVADEELSILPRLRGRSDELDQHLASMLAEHREHEPLLADLLLGCARLLEMPDDARRRLELGQVAAALGRAFEPHLVAEEGVIFPALNELLTDGERATIALELRARRQSA